MATVAQRLAAIAATRPTPPPSEGGRIAALPKRTRRPFSLAQWQRVAHPELEPWDVQLDALAEIEANGGGLCAIGCGHGKSLIALLAGTVLRCERVVVLCPAACVSQLTGDAKSLSRDYHMVTPTIMSYARLSQPGGTAILDKITKDVSADRVCIVADEAHKLRLASTRTRRLIRWFLDNERAHFVALSGTLTSKSVADFAHLSELALRDKSPLPRDVSVLASWGACIDSTGEPSEADWLAVAGLWQWHQRNASDGDRALLAQYMDAPITLRIVRPRTRKAMVRAAFQARLRSAPGVVASKSGSVGASLQVVPDTAVRTPAIVRRAMTDASELGQAPNGDPFTDAVDKWRALRQISAGYYYVWDWPGQVVDYEWLEARAELRRCIARELEQRSAPHYDSAGLIEKNIAGQTPSLPKSRWRNIHHAVAAWGQQRHKPEPPVKAIWLDEYLIDRVVQWQREQDDPTILWYGSKAVRDALKRRGVVVYGAGDGAVEIFNGGKRGAHDCAMSIAAQGTGLNLHEWSRAYVIEPPAGGKTWEQMVSRLHRHRQKADEVIWHYAAHTRAFANAMTAAKRDAEYIEESTGNRQKLNMARVIG